MSKYAAFRAELVARKAGLMSQHAKIDKHLKNTDREMPQDWSERGTFLENEEVLEALDTHQRRELEALDAAIERIDNDEFGDCASCGEAINDRRLAAIPWTPLCISCAE
jgi:RNA polymerase-binding protein DksA